MNERLFFFSSRRRHTRWNCDWSSDVCSSDLARWGDDPAAGNGVDLRSASEQESRKPMRTREIGRASCRESVDLGGRRIIEKKKKETKNIKQQGEERQ